MPFEGALDFDGRPRAWTRRQCQEYGVCIRAEGVAQPYSVVDAVVVGNPMRVHVVGDSRVLAVEGDLPRADVPVYVKPDECTYKVWYPAPAR